MFADRTRCTGYLLILWIVLWVICLHFSTILTPLEKATTFFKACFTTTKAMLAIANHIQIFHVPEHIFEKDLLCIITEYRLSHPATSANGIRAIQLWNTET